MQKDTHLGGYLGGRILQTLELTLFASPGALEPGILFRLAKDLGSPGRHTGGLRARRALLVVFASYTHRRLTCDVLKSAGLVRPPNRGCLILLSRFAGERLK